MTKKNIGFSMYDLVRYHCVFDGVIGGTEVSLDCPREFLQENIAFTLKPVRFLKLSWQIAKDSHCKMWSVIKSFPSRRIQLPWKESMTFYPKGLQVSSRRFAQTGNASNLPVNYWGRGFANQKTDRGFTLSDEY